METGIMKNSNKKLLGNSILALVVGGVALAMIMPALAAGQLSPTPFQS
jgi:hypothetical protein